MGVLDQVTDLKSKGASDKEIISNLREQGVSPKEISDALSQSKIKDAVSSPVKEEGLEPSVMVPEPAEELPTEGEISDEDLTPVPLGTPPALQQRGGYSTMHQEESDEDEYIPRPLPEFTQQQAYPQQQGYDQQQYGYDQQQDFQQGYMPQEGYEYQPQSGSLVDTDTVIEISEQVFADKMRGAVKQLEQLNEFRTLSETKIENMSERLKRIETSIDRLQMAILDRVGSYGRNLDTVKKEMEMMQDSFGKVIGHAAERHHHKSSEHSTPIQHTTHKVSHTKHHKKR